MKVIANIKLQQALAIRAFQISEERKRRITQHAGCARYPTYKRRRHGRIVRTGKR